MFWPPHILSIPPAATSPERRARSEPTRPSWHPWRAAKGIIEFRRTCGQMRGSPQLGTKSQLDGRLGVPASTRPNEGSCGAGEASAYLWYAGKEGGARSARRQTRERACAAPALKARPQHLGQRRRSPCCGDDTMGHSRGLGWGVCVWNERRATRKALSEAVGLGAREAWHGLSGGWCARCATQARRGWLRGRRRDGGPRRRSPGWSIARDRDHHLKHEEGGRGVERRPLRRGEHGHPRLDDITTPTHERRQPSGGDTHSWP